jgi:hypothetical protein
VLIVRNADHLLNKDRTEALVKRFILIYLFLHWNPNSIFREVRLETRPTLKSFWGLDCGTSLKKALHGLTTPACPASRVGGQASRIIGPSSGMRLFYIREIAASQLILTSIKSVSLDTISSMPGPRGVELSAIFDRRTCDELGRALSRASGTNPGDPILPRSETKVRNVKESRHRLHCGRATYGSAVIKHVAGADQARRCRWKLSATKYATF